MTHETTLIRCRQCGTRNRIPVAKLREGPRCGRCKHPFPAISVTSRPVMVTDRSFAEQVIASPLPVMLECWAAWCSACAAITPILNDLASSYAGRLKIA
ncbi:MAG: thioredoxin domain-containing protein, partial [Desulfosarcina sp.]